MSYPNKLCLHEVDSKCHRCTDRYVGCHNSCLDYAEFQQKLEEVKKKEKLDIDNNINKSNGWYYLRTKRRN